VDAEETGCQDVEWIHLPQDNDDPWGSIKGKEFFD
jgi:hypothetical protein